MPASPAPDPDTLKLLVDAAIAAAGLNVEPEWRGNIDAHFGPIAAAAATIMEFPLGDEIDTAPVFSA